MIPDNPTCFAAYVGLQEILRNIGPMAIAFSGGIDSSFLIRAAVDVLNNSVIAITAKSDTTPRQELADASAFALETGIRHIVVETRELMIPEFVKNPVNRCYICKKHRYEAMMKIAGRHGFMTLADGENAEDATDYRPGSFAARELGVRSPLREAGLTKEDIRSLSRMRGLHFWNKPALACLASRIPYHSPITPKKLRQIDDAETFIRGLGGFGQVRVRHFGDTAHIEMDADGMSRAIDTAVRNQLITYFKRSGFVHILLDMEGYRMGNLNSREPNIGNLQPEWNSRGNIYS